ncbi:DUF2235 domain-containing protein [Granulicella tundricola]|uniref:T6SS Phospholipase effector Tle1-like catalytic domain-containing protein n=1 Tax=Granulicella tundricola (strain ATCC BAA-1859 / DSM 23138 / MP5ACTX9) TaxID=1198114 RepID=E8WZ76_GRATM|nr:DUF2235 domain-containing protein [Granulicella tundricola]ADW67678.1 Protein of unknown function DUF2235 [Granulicella tundricola MP5ACTX9]
MSKNIIFCADGTWQLPRNNTNVYKISKGLTTSATQVVFYDDGIGSEATGFTRALDGALGIGIFDKIKTGYTMISQVYERGDQIFLFGFSRGAYTARSLAGMIATCGLPTGGFDDALVEGAFAAYRDPVNRPTLLANLAKYALEDTCITMVGVWDTVGALGIPAIFGGVDKQYGFLDTGLHKDVKNAYQCMSIDEQRCEFPITRWTSDPAPGQTIEQIWFSGCHGDVGGGTPAGGGVDETTTLSDIPLSWIVGKAVKLGLIFDPTFLAQYTSVPIKFSLDALHESWTPVFGKPVSRPIGNSDSIANSVTARIEYALTYQPKNLTIKDNVLDDGYNLIEIVDEDAM